MVKLSDFKRLTGENEVYYQDVSLHFHIGDQGIWIYKQINDEEDPDLELISFLTITGFEDIAKIMEKLVGDENG